MFLCEVQTDRKRREPEDKIGDKGESSEEPEIEISAQHIQRFVLEMSITLFVVFTLGRRAYDAALTN